jgi:hypothetical protein
MLQYAMRLTDESVRAYAMGIDDAFEDNLSHPSDE